MEVGHEIKGIGWLAGWLVGWLIRWLVVWLAGWLVGWLASWLAGWLIGWLAGWLVGFGKNPQMIVSQNCIDFGTKTFRFGHISSQS